MTPRVLYVSHTSEIGGGEISMLELLAHLDGRAEPVAAVPRGDLYAAVERLGIPVTEIPGTQASLRLSPTAAASALREIAGSARAVRRTAQRSAVDVVHANSLRAAAIGGIARTSPMVAFVRDCLPDTRIANATQRFVGRRADVVVANSKFTADRFERAAGVAATVVNPPVDLERFASGTIDRAEARAAVGLNGADGPALGVVAQLTPWKGQAEMLEAFAVVHRDRPTARLLLVGEVKFRERARLDNVGYETELHETVDRLGLRSAVRFLGERSDIATVMAALDVLLAPSWEEPFGRTVAEAMAAGVPVIATDCGGPSELIADGVDGRLLPPRRPDAWADAILELLADDTRAASFAARGLERARTQLGVEAHVERVLATYASAIS
jgi:glycosyltransferase involved in cell wall biosynthesis